MKNIDIISEKIRNLSLKVMPQLESHFVSSKHNELIYKTHLTISQLKVLSLFFESNKYKMSEISKALCVPLPTITHIIDQLVKDGYFKRSFDLKDRRIVYIEVTGKGKNILKEAKKFHKAQLFSLLGIMNESEQNKFVRAISELTEVIESLSKRLGNKARLVFWLALSAFIFNTAHASEDISLDKSIEYALKNNQRVLIAKEKIRSSEGNLTSANALLLPSLSVVGAYTRSSALTNIDYGSPVQIPVLDKNGIPTGSYVPFPSFEISSDRIGDIYIGKLSLQYNVFTWGRLQANYEIAFANKIINEADYNLTVSDVKYNVERDFYSILLTRELVNVLSETKKSLEAHLKTVQERFNVGLASNFEVLRAKVQLSNIEPQFIKAKNQLELSIISFNTNLGSETNDKYTARGELNYQKEEFDLNKCMLQAKQKRLEIKQADLRGKIANEAVTIAVSGYRPIFTLSAGYQVNRGQQMPPNDTVWQTAWDVGLALSMPLFDGFNASGRVEEAEANLQQVSIGKDQLLKFIDMEVKSSYLSLNAAENTILSQIENVNVAKQSLKIVNQRYKEGLATNLEVLDTEVSVLQAQINYLQALYEYNVAKEKLKKAIGE